jgi:peptidoglycan hydrolase-like protein with peptidoglycan-binding domain
MDYCGHCGEPVEGRFCRMCGTAVAVPGGARETLAAVSPAQGRGYGAAQGAVAAPVDPATLAAAPQAGYGPEPTQMLGATPSDFDAYFRTEDGTPGLHGQTQLLPPVLDDYQAPVPQTAPHTPPGGHGHGAHGNGDGDGPRSNRPLLLVAGAVVVVAAVILGLLYLGNQSTGSNTASDTAATPTASAAPPSAGVGVLQVPTDGASLAPSTPAAPSTTSAAATGQFSGDNLPLGPGSSGEWVKWVQEKLSALGYYHGQASGHFDQATALAVQQFQAAAGVTGDAASTVGMHTIVALAAAGSTPNLHLGSKSSDVSRLNTALSYATGSHLSGSRYTMSTAEAVMRYQSAVGLTPNGQVDAATWAKLQDGTLANG